VRRLRKTLALLLFFACLASATTVSVVSPVAKVVSSTDPQSLVDLGSFTGGAEIPLTFSRDAGSGKKWDYVLPVESFKPSGWTVRQGTQDSFLVVYFDAPYYANGSYLLKVMLADSDERLEPQTVSFKIGFNATSAPPAVITPEPTPVPPAEPMNWDLVFLVMAILCIPAILAATFYYTAPARKKIKQEEERRRKETTERMLKKVPEREPLKVPTKRIIVVEDEKPVIRPGVPEEKFVLKSAAPAKKEESIVVPVRMVVAETPLKKQQAKDVLTEVSFEPQNASTKEVINDIDAVLKELRPKYDWKKLGEEQALKKEKPK